MNNERMQEIWKWLWAVDNRPTFEMLEDGRSCFIYHRGDPYSIAEIRKVEEDEQETQEICELYVGHFDQKYGLPQAKDLIREGNKIDISVENPLELIVKRAMELTQSFYNREIRKTREKLLV